MLKICLGFLKSEPQYAYKRYAYKKKHVPSYRAPPPPRNPLTDNKKKNLYRQRDLS